MTKFVKDPIYGIIEIGQEYSFIYDLMMSKEMKRLKNIYQLGECFNVFFGAIHTRYSHAIGVYHNAKKILENINVKVSLDDQKVILAAALLHDLGHGPRSHCFEEWTNHNHELMTSNIILDKSTEVNQILVKHHINPEDVVSIINHQHKVKFYYQIVSSQIDADRLDYLLRDSYYTGAIYGRVDINILLKWIEVKNDELVFNYKAVGLIEELLFSRAQMFKQVYINNKVLSYQLLIKLMLERFEELNHNKFQFKDQYQLYYLLNPFLEDKQWSLDLFLKFDDNKFNLIIESWANEADETLKSLANNYLYHNEYYCLNYQDNDNFIKKLEYPFTLYNDKQPIKINDNGKITSLDKLKNVSMLLTEKNKFNFEFYFYKKQR